LVRDLGICQHCITTEHVHPRVVFTNIDNLLKLENAITLCDECTDKLIPILDDPKLKVPDSENNKLLKWCKNYMKLTGIYGYKVHGGSYQNAGIPDLDIIYHGISVRVELKLFGNPLTKIQYETMKEMRDNGAVVGVAHTLEEFKLIMEKADEVYRYKELR
jgi:hypothetical protein